MLISYTLHAEKSKCAAKPRGDLGRNILDIYPQRDNTYIFKMRETDWKTTDSCELCFTSSFVRFVDLELAIFQISAMHDMS